MVINDLRSNTYFARLILKAENEVHKKIIELDARPSDCLAVALQAKRPIFVSREVWDEVEDASELFEKMKQRRSRPSPRTNPISARRKGSRENPAAGRPCPPTHADGVGGEASRGGTRVPPLHP